MIKCKTKDAFSHNCLFFAKFIRAYPLKAVGKIKTAIDFNLQIVHIDLMAWGRNINKIQP